MANIVLNTKTYNGRGLLNGIARYVESSGGIAAAFSPLSGTVNLDSKSRARWKLDMPVVAEEASACACPGSVIRVANADINIRMDLGMTLAERTDFADRIKDLVSHADFRASIISLTQPTG